METKVCKVCGVELPISEFKKTPMSPNGISTCNKCCARKSTESKQSRKDSVSKGGGNSELSRFTARELNEELRSRGYKGKLYFTKEITI